MYTGLSSESDDEYLITEYFYDEHQRLIKTSEAQRTTKKYHHTVTHITQTVQRLAK